MDFHSMKRKQLQALCKKHKIPANLSNLEMANRLSEFLQDGDNRVVKQDAVKEQEGNAREIESIGDDVEKKGKKVRFSPDHELFEFTKSPEMIKRRSRRNSVSRVEIVESGEMHKEPVGRWGSSSTTQTGELKLMEAEVKQKKRGMKAVKCNDGQKVVSAVDSFEDDELEEADVVRPGRVTRLRGKMAADGVNNASKRGRKGARGDEKASDNVENDEHKEEIAYNHTRVTRFRAQKVTEAPAAEEKRGRKGVRNKVVAVRAEPGDNGESSAGSLSKKGDEGKGKSATISDERTIGNEKGLKEISGNKQIAGEHEIVEPQLLLRRSKRKATGVSESENVEVKGSRKTSKLLALDVSKVDTEISGVKVNPGRRAVLKIEEPIEKMEPRRSNRRKTMIAPDSLRVNTLRSSLPQSNIVPEVSKDEKMVIQPTGVVRRSRRKTLSQKLVYVRDTDSAVENLEAEKHVSESCLVEKKNHTVQKNTRSTRNTSKCKPPGSVDKIVVDSKIHQEKKVMKRKRGHVTGDVIKNNNDLNYGAQPLKGCGSENVVSAAATGKYADERNQPLRVDNPNLLDASSHHGSSGIGESFFLDVQLPDSKDSESANSLCSKNIISDMDPTSIRERHKKKEEVSVADSSCMNLANGESLGNSETKAAAAAASKKSAELGIKSLVSKDKKSTSSIMEVEKGKLLVKFDIQESIEQNITDVDKNDPETGDFGCNNKINDQVLAEGSNLSGEEGSAETHSSADSSLLGDHTDVKTDLEVAENEVDECVQPCVRLVDQHNEDHLGASSNIPDINNEDTSQTSGEDEAFESCGTDHTHSKSTSKLRLPSSGMTRHLGDCSNHRASKLAGDDEGGCSKDQRNASDHFSELDMPDLSDGQRDASIVSPDRGIFRDEYSVMNPAENCKDSEAVAATAICTDSTSVNSERGHEDVQMTTKEDVAETRESESSKSHKSKCDEDGGFSLAKLFDEERRFEITPQEKENFSGEHPVEDFNEQGMPHGSPSIAATTMCNSTEDHKAELSDEGGEAYDFKNKRSELTEADESGCLKSPKISNSQETNPSTPSSVSESQAENQKSLFAQSDALANANQSQGAWSNATELAGNAVCFMKSSEGKNIQVAEGLITDEDGNHANYSIDEEVSAEANISNVKSCPFGEIEAESLDNVKFQDTVETEHQHRKLVARQTESDAGEEAALAISRQSWTEAELQNLFGTSDEDAPPEPNDTFCEGSEAANMTMSKNKLTASNSGILTKEQEKEMEGESGIESDADIYENEFKLLFATPVNITTPCNTEEIYSPGVVLEGSVSRVTSIKEWSEVMKETVATGSTSNEKAQNAGYEIENDLSIGASLSINEGDDTCEEINEVQNFELLNTSTRVLSGAEFDGCEALEDQLTQNKEECVQETNSLIEVDREEHVPLAESCLNGENELESCTHMSETHSSKTKTHTCQNKSVGEMTQSTIAELSDADLQKSDVPENSHLLMASSNDDDILREISTETSSDPEVAKFGSSEENVTEKGISAFLSLKASLDCEESNSDDYHETEKLDEKHGNPKSSEDISDELRTNSDVAIQEIVAICNNMSQGLDQLESSDELENTCKEAKGMEMTTQILYNTNAAAEHGSFFCGEVSGPLSNLGMHISLEAGEPVQDAGFELGNSLCIGDLVSDGGGEDTCGEMNDVETGGFKISSTTVLSETEFDGCGASEEQLTENTGEFQKGTSFITEGNEEKVISLGQSCLFDEETDNDSESTEADINNLFGTPNNLDKLGGCHDMLIDTALSQSFSCKSRADEKSEQETTQSGEAAVKLSDADLQKPNISKNSQNITGEGTYALPSSKASPVYDELSQSTEIDDLNGAKICDEILDAKVKSSQDMPDESHINNEVATLKSLSDSNNQSEEAGLACGLEDTFLETKEADTTTHDSNNIIAPTDQSSSFCGAEMHLHLRDEHDDIENLDAEKPVFNLSIDNDKKDSEKAEECLTAQMVQFPIQELHFEENVEDFKSDPHTTSNLPDSAYNEILRESDVAGTIKEYIDFESSLPVIFDNSGASLPSDMLEDTDEKIDTENSASSAYKKDIADCLTPRMKPSCHSSSKDEDIVPSVDCLNTEIEEQEEATLLARPAQVSMDAASSPECVDEGTIMKLESGKAIEQEDDQSPSRLAVRKNAQTILIHGTPRKFPAMADMKENFPNQKRSNVVDFTAVRSAKRRPLQDLQ